MKKEELDFRRYVFKFIDANMYIFTYKKSALVIDPHNSEDARAFLESNDVENVTILLTHEHFDHTCGVNWFRKYFNTIVICNEAVLDKRRMRVNCSPRSIAFILEDRSEWDLLAEFEEEYTKFDISGDIVFKEMLETTWMGFKIIGQHTPGHSPGSSIFYFDDKYVFTGDYLIPGYKPTLRWPYSNRDDYYKIAVPILKSIDEKMIIYPGHGEKLRIIDAII